MAHLYSVGYCERSCHVLQFRLQSQQGAVMTLSFSLAPDPESL